MISGLTVRDEIEMSSNYMQQQSANVHSINSTVSKESAFGRQFFLLNVSETAVTPTCTEFWSSNYMQQQSANVHSINSTVSKESAFGRQFFLLNVSETAVTPTCTEF